MNGSVKPTGPQTMQFKYEAKKGTELIKGILTASTRDAALDRINEMGLIPVELIEVVTREKEAKWGGLAGIPQKVSDRSLTVFYRQLGRMVRSGIPLLAALTVAAEQTEQLRLREILESVKNEVRKGKSLAGALRDHKVFDPFTIAVIELGENTGHLEESLARLADGQERRTRVQQKVRNALIYPLLVVSLGTVALVFLLTYVVPQFSKLFADFGRSLPLPTRVLLAVSGGVQKYGLIAGALLWFLFVLLRRRFRAGEPKEAFDRWIMDLPLIGKMFFMAQFAMLTRSMEMLLKGGFPLLKALRIAIPVVSNDAMKKDLSQAALRVEQGETLSGALKLSGHFPLFAVHLILIGEETGRLEQSFADIADWYELEVEEGTRVITQLVEPITILGVGLLLGLIATAILMPVFSIDAIVY